MQPPTLEIHFHMCIHSPSVPVSQLSSFYIQREEEKSHRELMFFLLPGSPLQRQHSQRTDPRTAHHNQRPGQHVPSQVKSPPPRGASETATRQLLTSSAQFHSQPAQQQDGERGPPPQPPHQVRRVHQELLPGRLLGSGGARAALLPLLLGGVL